jgi:peptidoglycan/xylan/chitin deacetylase (PgdA/CDA1 family)
MKSAALALPLLVISFSLWAQTRIAAASPSRAPADFPAGFYDGDPLPARTAYLSFDDGPSDFTAEILDACQKESVKATFFLCARWAQENWMPNLSSYDGNAATLRRMYAEGHAVGSHTANHQSFADLSMAGIQRELKLNSMLLEWAIGPGYPEMTLVRPPFGAPWWRAGNAQAMSRAASALNGKAIVCMWNDAADSRDSDGYAIGEWYTKKATDRSAPEFKRKEDRIVQRIASEADGRGLVILMHDTHPTSVAALPRVISMLKQRGYSFATMEDWVRWRYGISSRELLDAEKPRLSLR